MSIENVKQFYIYASEDEYLAEALEKINNEIRKGNLVAEKLKELINLKIIPLAQEKGLDFTAEDLVSYSQNLVKGLSDEDLALVSGGIQPKTAAVALAITLGSSFLSAGVINLISNTPTQNQAIMSSSTSNEAKEKNRNRDSEASKDEHAELSRKKSINNLQDNMKETLKDKKVTLPSQKVKNSKLAKDFASMNDKFGDSKDQSKLLDTKKNVDELNEDIEVAAKDQDDTKELSSMPNVAIDAESDKKNDDFSSSSTKYVNAFGNIENGAGGTSVKDSTYKSIGETKEETDTKTTSTSESKPEFDASSSNNEAKPDEDNNKVKEKTTVVNEVENKKEKDVEVVAEDLNKINTESVNEEVVESEKQNATEVFSASNENVNAGSNQEEENNNIDDESIKKDDESNFEKTNQDEKKESKSYNYSPFGKRFKNAGSQAEHLLNTVNLIDSLDEIEKDSRAAIEEDIKHVAKQIVIEGSNKKAIDEEENVVAKDIDKLKLSGKFFNASTSSDDLHKILSFYEQIDNKHDEKAANENNEEETNVLNNTTSKIESKPELGTSSSNNEAKPDENNNKVKEKTTVVDYYEGLIGLAELFSDTANENTKEETNVLNNTTSKSASESKSDTSLIKGDNQKEIDVENKKEEENKDSKNELEKTKDQNEDLKEVNENNKKDSDNAASEALNKNNNKDQNEVIKKDDKSSFEKTSQEEEKESKSYNYSPFDKSFTSAGSQAEHLLNTLNLIDSLDEIEKDSRDAIENDIEYIAKQIVIDEDTLKLSGKYLSASTSSEDLHTILNFYKQIRHNYEKGGLFEGNVERARRTFRNLKGCKSWADVKFTGDDLKNLKNDIKKVYDSIKVYRKVTSNNSFFGERVLYVDGIWSDEENQTELRNIQKFYHTMYTPFSRSLTSAGSQAEHLLNTLNLIDSLDEIEKDSRDAIEKDIKYIAEQIVTEKDNKKAIDEGNVLAKGSDKLKLSGKLFNASTSSDDLHTILKFYEQLRHNYEQN